MFKTIEQCLEVYRERKKRYFITNGKRWFCCDPSRYDSDGGKDIRGMEIVLDLTRTEVERIEKEIKAKYDK